MAEEDDVTTGEENAQEAFNRKVKERVEQRRIERAADELEHQLELEELLKNIPMRTRRMARRVAKELLGRTSILDLFDQGNDRQSILDAEGLPCLVEDTIPLGRYTVVYGPPGVMKTHICNTLCASVATGGSWFDFYQCEHGVTAYWSGEGVEQFKPQFQAYDAEYGQNGAVPSRWWDIPLDLSRPAHVIAVVGALEHLRYQSGLDHGICIFDPDGMFRGGELGSVENYEAMAFSLKAMAKVMNHWAFVVVGHTEAKGERHRGTEHLRMYAGAHVHVRRRLKDEVVAVWEKFDRGIHQAIWITYKESDPGIVVQNARERKFTEADYKREAKRDGRKTSDSAGGSSNIAANGDSPQVTPAGQELREPAIAVIKARPGISKTDLCEVLQKSKRDVYSLLRALEAEDLIDVEVDGKAHRMTWVAPSTSE